MRHTMRARTSAVLLSAALLGGGAVACGSDDDGKKDGAAGSESKGGGGGGGKPAEVTPAVAIKKAVQKQQKIDSLTFTMRGTAPGEGKFTGTAAMTRKPEAMRMKMQLTGGPQSGTFEMRLVGRAMYMNGGEEAAEGMDGKSWLKVDMSKAGGKGGSLMSGSPAGANPTEDVEDMLEAEGLKKVGEEKIDGVPTTHYSGTIDLARLKAGMKDADAQTRERREEKLKEYRELGVDKLTMDMWIDENDHTKQFRTTSKTDKGPMDVTVTMGELNKPVTVTAPPASEVMDLSQEMGNEG
ncbi:DUF1396 domain-containing protein [Streptomyces boninensis]|uniref:DUF1396 domain-containing protein n=1 Tax=Streptomyces boninensis TaxID=2039455 RepID=UPI003B20BE9C